MQVKYLIEFIDSQFVARSCRCCLLSLRRPNILNILSLNKQVTEKKLGWWILFEGMYNKLESSINLINPSSNDANWELLY